MSASSIARATVYAILFACAATLLGLTAYQIHYTDRLSIGLLNQGYGNFYVPVVAELLATSCLAIIISMWFFIAILGGLGGVQNSHVMEAALLLIIWFMYLVGAAVLSRRWPNLLWCLGSQEVCRILDAIVAFSWINFVLITLLVLSCFMDHKLKEREPSQRDRNIPTNTIA